jgi:uncharacterized protein (TIGR02452 family)
MKTSPERASRAAIARQTTEILAHGHYQVGATLAHIAEPLERAVRATTAYSPADVRRAIADRQAPSMASRPEIEVTGESTLGAARRLIGLDPRIVCLNFASAKNPGGGFLNGARAQEEFLCRASGLYPCLLGQPAYYDANRSCRDLLYTDWAIYSPDVPILRDDAEALLRDPVLVSFITMPAPNRGAMREPDDDAIRSTLARRAAGVLAIAAERQHRSVVLGAWGCGAFGNDPMLVADVFRRVLDQPAFAAPFDRIVFAILEASRDRGNRAAFEAAFRGW